MNHRPGASRELGRPGSRRPKHKKHESAAREIRMKPLPPIVAIEINRPG
jgi:hypothetical protein